MTPMAEESWNKAMKALRQALAQPEQKIMDCVYPKCEIAGGCNGPCSISFSTGQSKREWVGLTRRELDIATLGLEDLGDCYAAIEAKLKEKNT